MKSAVLGALLLSTLSTHAQQKLCVEFYSSKELFYTPKVNKPIPAVRASIE